MNSANMDTDSTINGYLCQEKTNVHTQMIHRRRSLITLLLVTLFFASCTSYQTEASLNNIGTYIKTRPDSALTAIRSINTTTLNTRSLRAHYALLHAMALDKNWIDTTDIGVVLPAVAYYAKQGNADQKMNAYYYLGRIYENQGNINEALLAYTLAEEVSKGSEDQRLKGLLAMSTSRIYSKAHQTDKALNYALRGISLFQSDGDTLHYNNAIGRLAMLYQEKKEWHTADSIYMIALQLAEKDTVSMALYLSHYASMKVVQPEADPEGAIHLLKRRWSEYKKPLTLKDYGVYAYASAMLGDDKTCDNILAMIHKQPRDLQASTNYLEYRIARLRGDYLSAIERLKATFNDQNEMVDRLLNRSVNQTLEEYYENQTIEGKRKSQIQQLAWAIVLLVFIIVSGSIVLFLSRKREHEKKEAERLIHLSEESNMLLKNANSDLESKMETMASSSNQLTSELQAKIDSLQKMYGQLFKGQFSTIGELCKTYLRSKKNGEAFSKEEIYRKVKDMLSCISSDQSHHAQFEAQIDKKLDNVITHLKADLGEMSPLDERFLCYTIVGFDSRTISSLLGLTLSNVYTKKSRLKDRIFDLNSPYKEQYAQIF